MGCDFVTPDLGCDFVTPDLGCDFVTLVAMGTRETITLDRRAQQRLYVLNHVLADELTVEAAAQVTFP